MTHIDYLDAHKNKTFLLKQFFMKIKTRIGNLQNMVFLTIQQENCHISLIRSVAWDMTIFSFFRAIFLEIDFLKLINSQKYTFSACTLSNLTSTFNDIHLYIVSTVYWVPHWV